MSDPIDRAPAAARTVWTAPRTSRDGVNVVAIIGIVIGSLVGLAVIGFLALLLGIPVLLVASVLAFLPLVVVLLVIRWIDRWEPEPRAALWFAFLWGAAVSVAVALLVGFGVELAGTIATGTPGVDPFVSAVIQAPLVEEVAKGVGVLILFASARSHFDGPVDGLVYAATVAAGFAFTENILYFGSALTDEGAAGLGATFVVRGIFSPFAHVMFTACTGLALGLAARRGRSVSALLWFVVGLVGAIALHALWNGAFFFVPDVVVYYLFVQVPLFVFAIIVTLALRRSEMQVTRTRLQEYADAGWFTADEVVMLATPAGRRQARAWARTQPPARRASMRAFIRDATHLAFTRERIATGRADIGHPVDEHLLLRQINEDRAVLLG
ncbi:PrsW family intramembrane metalloprotease [Agromyces atrinae]|uniref:RsiW-degrading membrane proteinase PrsW (M82 family) n=1 Tax=Agromyces atrinae TaxID=592376 RepID=A0A852SIK9_9MICO|nr:PrsW family intramembrane metalloprotease [Agromyces atrinae]MCI2958966.1 PrsW family intramembrane metalloprotease [Agromyces atrinae]NYD65807.1 RsiW-degrading membrane proteinase PrsW (M82 family) [Agromyces atrinae]